MFFKTIIVIALLFVIISLFTAFYYLVKDPSSSNRVVKSLFIRVALSIGILFLLFIGVQLGWVSPHGFGQ